MLCCEYIGQKKDLWNISRDIKTRGVEARLSRNCHNGENVTSALAHGASRSFQHVMRVC